MDSLDLNRALGKALETTILLVQHRRECKSFYNEKTHQRENSIDYVLSRPEEIETFVEVILNSARNLHGITVIETSKIYSLIKNHFVNLLMKDSFYSKISEMINASMRSLS